MFKFEVTGIKCDNVNCDFNDKNVVANNYHDWLNKPCPKCGHNLLTEEDYKTVQVMIKISNMKIIRFLNYIGSFVDKLFKLKPKPFEGKMNGSGSIKFKEKKESSEKK